MVEHERSFETLSAAETADLFCTDAMAAQLVMQCWSNVFCDAFGYAENNASVQLVTAISISILQHADGNY